MNRHSLSVRDALNIAAQHGLSIQNSMRERVLIRDCIIMAREASARPRVDMTRKSAVRHFDDYMMKVAAEIKARPLAIG